MFEPGMKSVQRVSENALDVGTSPLRAPRRRHLGLVLIVALAGIASSAPVAAQAVAAPKLKAAFLYNFAKFTEWPADALTPGQPLSLCVVGDDFVAYALDQTISGHAVEGHQLTVQILKPDASARSCHLLFIGFREAKRTPQRLEALKDIPVLTVGDDDKFAEQGGVAQFITDGDRMRFAINVTAAQRAHVTLSSKLLSLAQIIKGERDVSR
jgi:hypothetical protein